MADQVELRVAMTLATYETLVPRLQGMSASSQRYFRLSQRATSSGTMVSIGRGRPALGSP